jgi:hypothetical protein
VRFATQVSTTELLPVLFWHVVQQPVPRAQAGHPGATQSIMALHGASREIMFSMQLLQAAGLASVPRE